MKIERLKNIIYFNRKTKERIKQLVRDFSISNDINIETIDIRNVLRELCAKQNIKIIEIPIKDNEIGAIFYVYGKQTYILINSAIPRVNINFALAHELYHILVSDSAEKFSSGDVFIINAYIDNENEKMANSFAAELLMPEQQIRSTYNFYSKTNDTFHTIIKLMVYFSTPYMPVLIRLLELDILHEITINDYINRSETEIRDALEQCDLNTDLLSPSYRDDSAVILAELKREGTRLVENELLSAYQLRKTLERVEKLLKELREN